MNNNLKLSVQEFTGKYWYASELKELAKRIGILKTGTLRKDELEVIIVKYLKTGKVTIPVKNRSHSKKNVEDTLSLHSIIKNYKNNKKTWIFITGGVGKLHPDFKGKSGAKYWLNRWREKKMQKGTTITYNDLINEYIRLCHSDRLPRIPSAKFNNFITDYLKMKRERQDRMQ